MPTKQPTAPWRPARPLLTAQQGAQAVGLSIPAFWKQVKERRLPAPVYPAPRAPRWFEDELVATITKTRALPADAMAARRALRPGHAGTVSRSVPLVDNC